MNQDPTMFLTPALTRRRRGGLGLYLALRSTFTAAGVIVAAIVLETTAMPKLQGEVTAMKLKAPPGLSWVAPFQPHLRYVAVPGLALGIAAIALRPFRRPLALAATAFTLAAVVILVGSFVALLAPLYQSAADMNLTQ